MSGSGPGDDGNPDHGLGDLFRRAVGGLQFSCIACAVAGRRVDHWSVVVPRAGASIIRS